MIDTLTTFGQSKIQHGKHSDRVYLMHLATADLQGIIPHLRALAGDRGYSKIFAKIPAAAEDTFLADGYTVEASIPNFFRGQESALFLGKYFSPERQEEKRPASVAEALDLARQKATLGGGHQPLDAALRCRQMLPTDTPPMAALYRQVFATYPFPIHDEAYLRQTMAEDVIYFGIWEGSELIALTSAEMDRKGENAEMTDFATRPDCQGRGLANYLLAQAEAAAAQCGIKTAYTIARSYSPGMNITFARNGYTYSGTLTHNTQISGTLESMNVWHKSLLP
ncbi:MAG: putative beta-lysine N-acetyltransferase [Deltaproteobacteria bacterium HGW-Deltaproteobacteria-4]|nr:MAG: putative beta-lysine N-acetyltransferase [Deltaproteobacteria bacterium HGW-Deltaproteobacteria-4]